MRDDGTLLYRTKPEQTESTLTKVYIILFPVSLSSLLSRILQDRGLLRYLSPTTSNDRLRDIDDLHLPLSTLSLPIQLSNA